MSLRLRAFITIVVLEHHVWKHTTIKVDVKDNCIVEKSSISRVHQTFPFNFGNILYRLKGNPHNRKLREPSLTS